MKIKKILKLFSFVFVIALSTAVLYHCAVNPVTGKKELMLISEKAEISLGRDVDRGIKAEYGIYDDPQLNAYVAAMGKKLLPHIHRPNITYTFAVLDTPVQNAFAAPGGYIYITRGLMAMMNSEAELAAVLGHELGHVNARHSARSMSRSILLSVGLIVAGELSKKIKDMAPLAGVAGQLLFLKYSRSDEYQADALGIEYASKAGYQAGEMVNFFNSLQRLTKMKGGGHLPNFLSTHPLTPKRIAKVQERLKAPEYPTTPLLVQKNSYLRKINGLVYGMNPRQGYVQGSVFYHPEMKFYFNIPPTWKVQNTPKKVTLAPQNGKAVLIFSPGSTTKNLNEYVDEQLASLKKINVLSQGFRNINGMQAFHKMVKTSLEEGVSQNQKQDIQVRVSSIKKGGSVFNFFAATASGDYYTYQNAIETTVGSFNNLTDANFLRRKAARVALRQASKQQSLRNFLQALQVGFLVLAVD